MTLRYDGAQARGAAGEPQRFFKQGSFMSDGRTEVVVVDVRIPFGSMVILLVKWAVAAIPAAIILIILAWAVSFALGFLPHWGGGRGMI
jgi:hypothetical protein